MSQSGHQPPIAPAKGIPLQAETPKTRRSTPTRIGASRKWVLPPRPKPGRKPKQKDRPIKVAPAASDDADCGLCERDECLCQDIGLKSASPKTPISTEHHHPRLYKHSEQKQPGTPVQEQRILSAQSFTRNKESTQTQLPAEKLPASELGTEITLSSLSKGSSSSSSSIGAAVPLKRNPNPSAPKFMRASVEDMLSPVALKPTYKLKIAGEGCGFCTANSPCVCAEQEAAKEQEEEQQAAAMVSVKHEAADDVDYGCSSCQSDPMSMLFCLSLGSAQPLPAGSVAIPCTMAFRTLVKHPKFATCDLGQIIVMLESSNKMIGIQSVNRVLQYLNGT